MQTTTHVLQVQLADGTWRAFAGLFGETTEQRQAEVQHYTRTGGQLDVDVQAEFYLGWRVA